MSKLKYLSLFSGIGSPEKALSNLGVDYELLGFSEIDDDAVKSYCAIHNTDKNLNYGDIDKLSEMDLKKIFPIIDLITHGSPCQDYTNEGKEKGGDEGSGTRSSLMWKTVNIVSKTSPKYILWENVPGVLHKKHKHNYDKYLFELDKLGYNNYSAILNAIHYNVPQNRRRVFVVSIRKDVDNESFQFPKEKVLNKRLIDLLDIEVDESYYIKDKLREELVIAEEYGQLLIRNATRKGYAEAHHGDGIDFNFPTSDTRRGRVQSQRSQTLKRGNNLGVLLNGRMRYFTSNECWRLMGFTDEDYQKAKNAGVKDQELYNQAGNSIVVNVVEAIFKELLKIN